MSGCEGLRLHHVELLLRDDMGVEQLLGRRDLFGRGRTGPRNRLDVLGLRRLYLLSLLRRALVHRVTPGDEVHKHAQERHDDDEQHQRVLAKPKRSRLLNRSPKIQNRHMNQAKKMKNSSRASRKDPLLSIICTPLLATMWSWPSGTNCVRVEPVRSCRSWIGRWAAI